VSTVRSAFAKRARAVTIDKSNKEKQDKTEGEGCCQKPPGDRTLRERRVRIEQGVQRVDALRAVGVPVDEVRSDPGRAARRSRKGAERGRFGEGRRKGKTRNRRS